MSKNKPIKLTHPYGYPKEEVDVETAVRRACTESHSHGSIERVSEMAECNTLLLGRLIRTLADKGLLNKEEILEIIGWK